MHRSAVAGLNVTSTAREAQELRCLLTSEVRTRPGATNSWRRKSLDEEGGGKKDVVHTTYQVTLTQRPEVVGSEMILRAEH